VVAEGDAVDGILSAQLGVDGLPDMAVRRGCEILDKLWPDKSREFIRERCEAWMERYLSRRFGVEPIPATAPEPYDPARDAVKLKLKRRVDGWAKR
jgi:hypothetical protein